MTALRDAGLWRGEPLILASKSLGRARILEAAGIPFEAIDSQFDERAVPGLDNMTPAEQASILAREKARAVSSQSPGRFVLGADQTLAFQNRTVHKAPDFESAIAQLRELGGAEHRLHSAVACVHDGRIVFELMDIAAIRMRSLAPAAVEAYARGMGERLLMSVGCYEIEGLGANLIERVQGDMFTVIGLPLFMLLAELRRMGIIRESVEAE